MDSAIIIDLIMFAGVACCNVRVAEQGYVTCQRRWNGALAGELKQLTVYDWDGIRLFPVGANSRLFGTNVERDVHFYRQICVVKLSDMLLQEAGSVQLLTYRLLKALPRSASRADTDMPIVALSLEPVLLLHWKL